MNYRTEQEQFWAGSFGNDYLKRNRSEELLAANLSFFAKALRQVGKPSSLIEFGANIGMNMKAFQLLFPSIDLFGIEINETAASELSKVIGEDNVYNQTILEFEPQRKYDVSLIKGVLIHINPEELNRVYEKLYQASKKYILVCEYYNPTPVTVEYRGHENRLFKRDFAGEMLDTYSDLRLVEYGFSYKRDVAFPQDDFTWFLLEKESMAIGK